MRLWRYLKAVYWWVRGGCRYASDMLAHERLTTCWTCDELERDDWDTDWCNQCGCRIMQEEGLMRSFSKVYYPKEACPLKKW